MTDPRLNSVHLPAPRRQEFRHAREIVLQAKGHHTLCADQVTQPTGSNTFLEESLASSPAGSGFWLQEHGRVFPLKVGVNTIGRAPENDVVLTDGYVSRRHCAILVHRSGGCEMHDTASKNGTFLNGRRLYGPTPLSPGDKIRMCDHHLVLLSDDRLPPAAHAPTLAN